MLVAIVLGALLAIVGALTALPITIRTVKRAASLSESPTLLTMTSLQLQAQRIASSAEGVSNLVADATTSFSAKR